MNFFENIFNSDLILLIYRVGWWAYLLMVIGSIYTVLFERRDPTRAFTWIVIIVLLPVVGLIFFIFFGQSYRKRKLYNTAALKSLRRVQMISQWQLDNIETLDNPSAAQHMSIVKLLLNTSNAPLLVNNSLQVLQNGKETFSAIFEALESATHHIHLEYYIIADDQLGQKLAEVLCRKAQQRVEVRLLFDDVGSWSLPHSYRKKLTDAGVEVASFGRVIFPYLTRRMNYRNHRKIVVVDGRVGFMGGLNFAQKYISGTPDGVWRDTHLRLCGQAVGMLQATFVTDWFATTRKHIESATGKFAPPTEVVGQQPCQIATSGPDSDYAAIMQCFFAAIARAKKYIYITTPYFLPSEAMLTALKVAALSGVEVQLMLPHRSDAWLVHWASRSYFKEMMDANIKIYLYKKGFIHSKTMVIDGTFSSIGSANMDPRSLEDNYEVTAMIYHTPIAQELEAVFEADMLDSQLFTPQLRAQQSRLQNLVEALARLLSPLL